jgi:hypothetical protein
LHKAKELPISTATCALQVQIKFINQANQVHKLQMYLKGARGGLIHRQKGFRPFFVVDYFELY